MLTNGGRATIGFSYLIILVLDAVPLALVPVIVIELSPSRKTRGKSTTFVPEL